MEATIYIAGLPKECSIVSVMGGRTSFIEESTDRHFMLSLTWREPGKTCQKARARMRRSLRASRTTTVSAEG